MGLCGLALVQQNKKKANLEFNKPLLIVYNGGLRPMTNGPINGNTAQVIGKIIGANVWWYSFWCWCFSL